MDGQKERQIGQIDQIDQIDLDQIRLDQIRLDRQVDRQLNIQTYLHSMIEKQIALDTRDRDAQIQVDRQTDGWRVDGQMDGSIDR